MTDIVDTYRANHTTQPRHQKRRWSLALAGLGAMIVLGMAGLQIVAGFTAASIQLPAVRQDSTLAPRSATLAAQDTNDAMITGSATRLSMPRLLTNHRHGFYIIAIGCLTGLLVYLGLSRLVGVSASAVAPGSGNTPAAAIPRVRRRRDVQDSQRYHGGPFRN